MTVQEKYPDGLKARTKNGGAVCGRPVAAALARSVTPPYPATFCSTSSPCSSDRPKDSTLFDAAEVPLFSNLCPSISAASRSWQDDPLAGRVYKRQPSPDAEMLAYLAAKFVYSRSMARGSPAPWHALAIGYAGGQQRAAGRFPRTRREKLKIERNELHRGSQPAILEEYLHKAEARAISPTRRCWAPTDQGARPGALTRSCAVVRQEKTLLGWGRPIRHRVGTPVGKDGGRAALRRIPRLDPRWLSFAEPRIARWRWQDRAVTRGAPARFRINVSFRALRTLRRDNRPCQVPLVVSTPEARWLLVANAESCQDGEWAAKSPLKKRKNLKPGVQTGWRWLVGTQGGEPCLPLARPVSFSLGGR